MQQDTGSNGIGVAVLGAGYWGKNLVRVFRETPGWNLISIVDPSSKARESLRSLSSSVEVKEHWRAATEDPRIHAVAIATPVSTHAELVREALMRGKHVLVEKPLAKSSAQCRELIDLAKQRNLVLLVDHTFLYTPEVRKIGALVRQGELGKLHYLDSERINLGLISPDVSVHWDLAPHDLSIFHYIVGAAPLQVSATGCSHFTANSHLFRYEMVHLTLTYPEGVMGNVHVSWVSPVKMRKMIIGGNQKMIVYNDVEPSEKVKLYDRSVQLDFSKETPAYPFYRSGDVVTPYVEPKEALQHEVQHFLKCIQGEEMPFTSAEQGLLVVQILEAADRSLALGGAPVRLEETVPTYA